MLNQDITCFSVITIKSYSISFTSMFSVKSLTCLKFIEKVPVSKINNSELPMLSFCINEIIIVWRLIRNTLNNYSKERYKHRRNNRLFWVWSFRSQWSQSTWWCICQWSPLTRLDPTKNYRIGAFRCQAVWYFKNTSSIQWMCVKNSRKVSQKILDIFVKPQFEILTGFSLIFSPCSITIQSSSVVVRIIGPDNFYS